IERRADAETESFVAELNTSSDIQELAKVPLLLCLLIYHSFYNVQLPQSRFKAYDSLIQHLISTHPRRRRTVAFLTDAVAELSDDDIKRVLARLAYHIHEQFGEGLIDLIQAENMIDEYLKDNNSGFGFGQREARRYSKEILSVSEQKLGLIVRKSTKEIGFYHRVFQEYLAAYYLSSLPLTCQLKIVSSFCADPRWREVILGVFHHTNRSEDIKLFVDEIRKNHDASNPLNQCNLDLLLSETAFSDFNCAPNLAKGIARDVFKKIELSGWMPHRQRLLQQVLNGLRSTKVRELVESNLKKWFPCRERYHEEIFNAMAKWPMSEDVINCLFKGLHDEEEGNQIAAAKALADLAGGDHKVFEMLNSLVQNAISPKTVAAAIKALFLGWFDSNNLKRMIEAFRDSSSPEVRFASILGKIKMKIQTDEDRRELFQLGTFDSRLNFLWRQEIASALMTGWPKSVQIKKACLEAVARNISKRVIDQEIACQILLEGYPQDPDVAQYCKDEITYEEYPFIFLHLYAWRMLSQNFQDNIEIVKAIDEWLPKQKYREPEISFAALVGRTSTAKSKLLSLIGPHVPFWPVDSLLKGWGMKDPEVSEKLLEFAYGPAGEACQIGRSIPQIIEDKTKCRKRLLELLQDPGCKRPSFVLDGLRMLGDTQGDTKVVDLALKIIDRIDSDSLFYEELTQRLIINYSSDSRVRKLAKKQLTERKGNFGAIASAYADDKEIRRRVLEMANPLPSQLRSIIAERLRDQTTDSASAMSLLRLYDHDVDEIVKTQASINYHNWLKAVGSNVEQQIGSLSKDIVCYGPDYEERRRAAFCGLVALDRLEIMEKAQESIGKKEPSSISLYSGLRLNTILIRHILENWKVIKKSFGEDLWRRLSKSSRPNKISVWEILSVFADEFPVPRDDLLHFLEDNKEQVVPPNLLRFLGRVRPKSALLLDYCLKGMFSKSSKLTIAEESNLVAAELLGVHFGGDNDVLAAILSDTSMIGLHRYDPIIVALCAGWPNSKELKEITAEIQERKQPMVYPAYFSLICQMSPSTLVFNTLIKKLSTHDHFYLHQLHRNIRFFLRRIQRDDTLLEMLIKCVQDNPTPSEKGTIPKLVFSARGSLTKIRTWCTEEVAKQLNQREFTEIGFDLFNDEPRQVLHSLLDVLDQHGRVESYGTFTAQRMKEGDIF
ncbi:MAG: NACHT domain-containing protein, partial [Promethearchaeota archaeon]